ncbi:peptidase M48-like protein [Nonomuraea fuscirosea]|uniref:Peptidase M48-like protein n=1 Tax=Nonomuraea fuscirosea TaxID=1291556 RepID=A0A2T0MKR3_9ACTN|nr:M56 family metallopeptidase [Nonomuraea fuscirosea]PRX58196.1 peptidase M48-like protein [Nonomuraea fuscirosea]
MNLEIYLPTALLALGTLVVAWRQPRMHPAWTARILILFIGGSALAVLGLLAFLVVMATGVWTPAKAALAGGLLADNGRVPLPVGVAAGALLVLIAVAVTCSALRWRRELREARAVGTGVVADERPYAVAVPGHDGGVILSSGLVGMLSRRELEVVFRHEAAHLEHRHHLYLMAGSVFTRVFPCLAYPYRALRYALERWADEEAAVAVGDRVLTARTIARVALAQPPAAPGRLALTGSHVTRRVTALLGRTPPDSRIAGPVLFGGAWMAAGSAISPTVTHHVNLVLVLL